MSIAIKVPVLPQSIREARVGHWYREVGDVIARGETLVELEVRGEIIPIQPSQAGIIEKIFFHTGDIVPISTTLALLKAGLPNLFWDEEQRALILETYKASGVTTSMEYELRQMIRLAEGKIGKGFGSTLALPQIRDNAAHGGVEMGMGREGGAQGYYKSHPKLNSSQFSGDFKNPNVTAVPANEGAQKAPQNAPTLGATPKFGSTAPTPKPSGGG